jgi:HPt (histidine-containing phosphotransfer) domain-containing protein
MPAQASTHSTIDQEALARLRRFGGDKLLRDMIDLFAQHGPERVVAARAGFETADSVVVKAALHALKSSAGQLGALAVQELCATGEMRAAKGDLSDMSSILVRLEDELRRALTVLAAHRKPA